MSIKIFLRKKKKKKSHVCVSLQLCEYAQSWANHLAHNNTFYYKNDRNVGHNLYCRPGGGVPGDIAGQEVASYWYSAVRQYDFLKEPDVLHANVNAGKKLARAFRRVRARRMSLPTI